MGHHDGAYLVSARHAEPGTMWPEVWWEAGRHTYVWFVPWQSQKRVIVRARRLCALQLWIQGAQTLFQHDDALAHKDGATAWCAKVGVDEHRNLVGSHSRRVELVLTAKGGIDLDGVFSKQI